MNRRRFFRKLLGTAAAITVASAVELGMLKQIPKFSLLGKVFKSEPIVFMDLMFAHEAKRLEGAIKNVWEDRSAFSYLMEKPPIPDGTGFNYKTIP